MGKVFTHMTMSLDGFIADPNDQVGELFDWYGAGGAQEVDDGQSVHPHDDVAGWVHRGPE